VATAQQPAQQPAQPPVDRAALERQAEVNKLPDNVLQTLHTPVIYIQGGPTDIAYANGMDDFKRIGHVPVAIANLPVGHGGTFLEPNGGAPHRSP